VPPPDFETLLTNLAALGFDVADDQVFHDALNSWRAYHPPKPRRRRQSLVKRITHAVRTVESSGKSVAHVEVKIITPESEAPSALDEWLAAKKKHDARQA
jgi:hypothetical protein